MTRTPSAVASDTGPAFEAIDVRKEYDDGKVAALRGVDFRIENGEFVSIVGPSGCGKSTLLSMLGALATPTSGSIRFRGNDLAKLKDPSAYRAKEIGFIFQAFHLLPTFTVEENVQIPMFGLQRSRAQRRDRAVELLEAVGLSHRRTHLPSELSGGERQRAAIARSLANEPGILLADEPTGNLDSENAAIITELLDRLRKQNNTTLVIVTHDFEVASLASRMIRMKDGQIISQNEAGRAPN